MILYPLRNPAFVELDDIDQEITLVRKQAIDMLAGFMGFMNRRIHFKI